MNYVQLCEIFAIGVYYVISIVIYYYRCKIVDFRPSKKISFYLDLEDRN